MSAPNPGSRKAIAQGCTCPVLDNAHGRGAWGGRRDDNGHLLFWRNADCPLHARDLDPAIHAAREAHT